MTINLDELTELAEAAGAREWGPAEACGDESDGSRSWHVAGVVRWRGYTNVLRCDDDEATARYLAEVHPAAVLELLDTINTLSALVPVDPPVSVRHPIGERRRGPHSKAMWTVTGHWYDNVIARSENSGPPGASGVDGNVIPADDWAQWPLDPTEVLAEMLSSLRDREVTDNDRDDAAELAELLANAGYELATAPCSTP